MNLKKKLPQLNYGWEKDHYLLPTFVKTKAINNFLIRYSNDPLYQDLPNDDFLAHQNVDYFETKFKMII